VAGSEAVAGSETALRIENMSGTRLGIEGCCSEGGNKGGEAGS